jgi:tetratricopeptide repeat protein
MPTSEIEKLERRYAENPQGLTFAPLAEVHRKNGDVARALELLRAGLELHPNYIPASIVLGRCHWDLGDLPAAESAFAHVLRLDDENVIALKSLADINERLERFGEAQRWLHRLVSVDRSNEEAREQLSRLETAKERGARPAAATSEPSTTPDLPHEITAANPPSVTSAPSTAAAPLPPTAVAPAPPLDLTATIADPPPKAEAKPKPPAIEFLDITHPVEKPAQPAKSVEADKSEPQEPGRVPGLSPHEFVPPPENTYRLHPELTHEFGGGIEPPLDRFDVETTEEVELQSSGAAEFRVPNAAEDFMDLAARMNPPRESTPPPISDSPVDAQPALSEAQVSPSRAEVPPAPQPVKPAPTPVEPAVTSRAAEGSKPSYSADDTKGQSVASFFRALLAARPPGSTNSTATPGSSTTDSGGAAPAPQDGLSLSSVFGQERQLNEPPVPAGGPLKDAAVSFDDFFASAGGGSSSPGSGDPKNDDLDSFQSWLQNLKR